MSRPTVPSPPPPQPHQYHFHHQFNHHSPPPSQQQPQSLTLEVTLLSAKHLKNVNWKNGPLQPYAILWVDPDHKLTSKSDDSGNTKPIWNQRFLLPLPPNNPSTPHTLSLEIFHSKASQTPKPFVGSVSIPLPDLPDPTNSSLVRSFDLLRPSGRPHGKIRLKLAFRNHPDYHLAPPNAYYYSSSAPPYPSGSPYPYSVGYGAPSAPVEYGQGRVGAVASAFGGMTIEEGARYEDRRVSERDDSCSDYRGDY